MKERLKKNNFILPIMLGIFLLSLFSVSVQLIPVVSALNITTLNINNVYEGTALNITALKNASDPADSDGKNGSFYYSTNNGTSWTLIANKNNATANQTSFSVDWDSTTVKDNCGTVYGCAFNFTLRYSNGTLVDSTSFSGTATRYEVEINNGVPTCTIASSSLADSSSIVEFDSFLSSADADSTIGVRNCTFSSNAINTTASASADVCSQTISTGSHSLLAPNSYTYIQYLEDYNGNKTGCTARTVTISAKSAGGGGSGAVSPPKTTTEEGIVGQSVSSVSNFFTQSVPNFFKSMWDAITFWN